MAQDSIFDIFVVEPFPLDCTRDGALGGTMSRHVSTPGKGGDRFNSLSPLKPMSIIGKVLVSNLPNYHLVNETLYYHYLYINH